MSSQHTAHVLLHEDKDMYRIVSEEMKATRRSAGGVQEVGEEIFSVV